MAQGAANPLRSVSLQPGQHPEAEAKEHVPIRRRQVGEPVELPRRGTPLNPAWQHSLQGPFQAAGPLRLAAVASAAEEEGHDQHRGDGKQGQEQADLPRAHHRCTRLRL